jgi:hypothetical protein
MMMGRNDVARREFDALYDDLSEGPPGYTGPLAVRQGDTAMVEKILARLRAEAGEGAHYQFAEIYAEQREKDRAIEALEKAWTVRDPGLTMILVDPFLDPLRGGPRFTALLKRLDFPT